MSNEREIEFLKMEVERLGGRVLDLESNLEGFEQGIMSQDADEPVRRIIAGSGISIHRSGETVSITTASGEIISIEDLVGGGNYPEGPGSGSGGESCAPADLFYFGTWPAPYDLYDITATTVKVRGSNAIGSNNKLIGLAGIWEEVDAGAGGEDFDAALTPGDDEFIYLKVVRGSGAANTLEMGAWPGDATDGSSSATIYIPLWYFKVTAGEICLILDFRHVPRIDMMGN